MQEITAWQIAVGNISIKTVIAITVATATVAASNSYCHPHIKRIVSNTAGKSSSTRTKQGTKVNCNQS